MRIRAAITLELERPLSSDWLVVDLKRMLAREVKTWLARHVAIHTDLEDVTTHDDNIVVELHRAGTVLASLRVEVMRDR